MKKKWMRSFRSLAIAAFLAGCAQQVALSRMEVQAIEQYRLHLMDAISHLKTNPNLGGVLVSNEAQAVVRMNIDELGEIAFLGVHQSAGSEVLDRDALERILKVKPTLQTPGVLRGRAFWMEIPITYQLQETR